MSQYPIVEGVTHAFMGVPLMVLGVPLMVPLLKELRMLSWGP